MPILDVEIVAAEPVADTLASRLADMAGEVFGSPPGSTWVRVRTLSPQFYAEDGTAQPEGWNSVFVTVRKAKQLTGAALEKEAQALTEGIARVCGRSSQHVHLLYEPDVQGRIAFGGRLKT